MPRHQTNRARHQRRIRNYSNLVNIQRVPPANNIVSPRNQFLPYITNIPRQFTGNPTIDEFFNGHFALQELKWFTRSYCNSNAGVDYLAKDSINDQLGGSSDFV
ncbi:17938_t:CDS:2 [Funneliformis caledonium]|uniref:17938_t:CDS:1 n=1 Tax=Funneliformis caledonium TaxID=1117310 RepID=A0A9N9AH20_9GLOM|nr:17938_t:CDS:2 [Funneliformis caledonium]